MKYTEGDDGHEIEVRVGDTFEVSLPEIRTSGFSWSIKSGGAPVCSMAADVFGSKSAMPGESGAHRWSFKVDAPGTATIEMIYRRPWDAKSPPARTYSLRVRAGG
jgi:inhibitor of cysteine peptidase